MKRSVYAGLLFGLVAAVAILAGAAWAATPTAGALGLQAPASPGAENLNWLHNLILVIITAITIFVLALLLYVMVRFRKSRNPTPSRNTHHTGLEIAWTLIPVLILVVIAIPSLRLLYFLDRTHEADMTVKVTAHQWYWSYQYPDHGDFTYDSRIIRDADLTADQRRQGLRLLAVDNELVVPAGANVRVLITSGDVIHSFFLPSLGVQTYGIIGRNNETWMRINEPGVYYGQCNQICGVDHGYMPIAVRALPRAEFDRWVAQARTRYAEAPVAPAVAQAAAE